MHILTACKRALTLVLAAALAAAFAVPARAATISSLRPIRTYYGGFNDIAAGDWFFGYAVLGYEYGYFDGVGDGTFSPGEPVTAAEAIKIAANINCVYETGGVTLTGGDPWYAPYVGYAVENGIVLPDEFPIPDAAITRSDFALILSRALPEEALAVINNIAPGAIPDVAPTYSYADSVYMLYRAGVLTGGDDYAFFPNRTITRAEAAAIAVRLVSPADRVALTLLAQPLPSDELYRRCAPAVFLLEIYDGDGNLVRMGSGFFISPDGVAVTNCHVASNVGTMKATTADGEEYEVLGIYARDMRTDCAVIRVAGRDFPYLIPRDSDTLHTGEEIYTIGSPVGLINTISRGIISTVSRDLSGMNFIQIDANISQGSSGGALLDAFGFVVGITTATVSAGQSLNLAVPINVLRDLEIERYLPFREFEERLPYYPGYFPVPDYGLFSGEQALIADLTPFSDVYYYRPPALNERDRLIEGYSALLEENGFTLYYSETLDVRTTIYVNYFYGIAVFFGESVAQGVRYWCVEVMFI